MTYTRQKITVFFFLLCLIGFAGSAALVSADKLNRFDKTVIDYVQGWESPGLTAFMKFISGMGTGLPIVLIMLFMAFILYRAYDNRKELILFIVASAGSALLNLALKSVFQRERPNLHRIAEATGYSFPSGHSMAAFSLYALLVILLWEPIRSVKGRILVSALGGFMILATGISRIYLGVHYPSDVCAGYLASGCWLAALLWLFYYSRLFRAKRV
ncbi:phosphatase PAP2 family protein [Gorillibacterium massiliense]|uniref:phosphatase PAP2 family protein n=1 Tax=Gorillibacterium massiliense TaxID=1280390 RepID=UPI0004ACC00F|nr:phosphatase PAP2 family protein [Gorillibacterium massiliense]